MVIASITSATQPGLDAIGELAQQPRVDSIRASTSAGSGHPTSSMSAADLVATLIARHFRYDWDKAKSPSNDHLIFSKGHASPLLVALIMVVIVGSAASVKAVTTGGGMLALKSPAFGISLGVLGGLRLPAFGE